jgi:Transposase DDE domain
MPFKANAARRHRIRKQWYRVTNWAKYDASLRQRGSLTVWFSAEAIASWRAEPRTTRGGQPHYSALGYCQLDAKETTLPRDLSR